MDKTEAQQLACCTKSFTIIEGELYKKSHTKILQRCIPTEQGRWQLKDIHGGTCGHHAALRTLIENILGQGFYWLTAMADATNMVRTCKGCQHYSWQTHLPAQALQMIPITWLFMV
jgi:hypothetical protein